MELLQESGKSSRRTTGTLGGWEYVCEDCVGFISIYENVACPGLIQCTFFSFHIHGAFCSGGPGGSDGADPAAPSAHTGEESEALGVSLRQGCQGGGWCSQGVQALLWLHSQSVLGETSGIPLISQGRGE